MRGGPRGRLGAAPSERSVNLWATCCSHCLVAALSGRSDDTTCVCVCEFIARYVTPCLHVGSLFDEAKRQEFFTFSDTQL